MRWEGLRAWFAQAKRPLPWRDSPTPYRVLVSEIMLQQTRAEVVIPYFERWMERFPTLEVLAAAAVEEVVKAWEGLGYYSRARNLHLAAKQIVAEYAGEIPQKRDELLSIRGIGPYTAGAILSFAHHKRAVAVDGNVLRVASRLLASEADISKPKTRNLIEEALAELLPQEKPWEVMEALIELGASQCARLAACEGCPLRSQCKAHAQGRQGELPINTRKTPITQLTRQVAVITCGESVLLCRGEAGKVMAGLYYFPYFEAEGAIAEMVSSQFDLQVELEGPLSPVSHTFTRYRAQLYPYLLAAEQRVDVPKHTWVAANQLATLPFCSGHRQVKEEVFA